MTKKLFICYRRDDVAGHAGRLYDRLEREFGANAIFRDIETLCPGDNFVKAIREALSQCSFFLVVIGPR